MVPTRKEIEYLLQCDSSNENDKAVAWIGSVYRSLSIGYIFTSFNSHPYK